MDKNLKIIIAIIAFIAIALIINISMPTTGHATFWDRLLGFESSPDEVSYNLGDNIGTEDTPLFSTTTEDTFSKCVVICGGNLSANSQDLEYFQITCSPATLGQQCGVNGICCAAPNLGGVITCCGKS